MIFDLTLFENDDLTPFFGTGDGLGGVTVPDFSTDPAHPRPYLDIVANWSATEIDFPAGSSSIGAITVRVLDKRTDAGDQRTGILTSRLKDVVGARALLRSEHPSDGMLTAFNGVVQSYSMGGAPEGLVMITLQLRDVREREREKPLFLSNFVLFGADGAQGPATDYGAKPGGGYILDAVAPFLSVVGGGLSHFARHDSGGVFWGVAAGPSTAASVTPLGYSGGNPFKLADLDWPTPSSDGLFYYRDIQVRWRAKGSDDPWVTLRNMPRPVYANVVSIPNAKIPGASVFYGAPTLYFGSLEEDELPDDGEEIEFQLLAVEITPDTPFWWDQGSFGDLLKEIYDGEHSLDPPKILYDPVAMAAFQASTPPARLFLAERVDNMRDWVEKNIYQPLGYAPGFDVEMRTSPVSWRLPENTQSIPRVTRDAIIPIGSWDHGSDNVINTVEFTYIREHLDDLTTAYNKKTKRFLGFLWKTGTENVVVPGTEDDRAPWQRLIGDEVRHDRIDIESVATFGSKKLEVKAILARSIAGVDGAPEGGDVQDELGARMAESYSETLLARFSRGAPVRSISVLASDPAIRDLKVGDWIRIDLDGMPDYETGRRG